MTDIVFTWFSDYMLGNPADEAERSAMASQLVGKEARVEGKFVGVVIDAIPEPDKARVRLEIALNVPKENVLFELIKLGQDQCVGCSVSGELIK